MSNDGADWLRTQLTSFGCAACRQPYESARIRLLAERDGLFFVDLGCAVCGTQAVAIVTVEVDENDVPRPTPTEGFVGGAPGPEMALPVNSDDVLAMHALLSRFEGDMASLLVQLDGRSIARGRPEAG